MKCKIYEPTHEKRDLSIVRFVILQMSHLMKLWHFSSSVSSYKQPSSEASCLIFGQTLCLFPFFICANGKGSGETGQRLHGCAGSPEPSLVAYVISTIIS